MKQMNNVINLRKELWSTIGYFSRLTGRSDNPKHLHPWLFLSFRSKNNSSSPKSPFGSFVVVNVCLPIALVIVSSCASDSSCCTTHYASASLQLATQGLYGYDSRSNEEKQGPARRCQVIARRIR